MDGAFRPSRGSSCGHGRTVTVDYGGGEAQEPSPTEVRHRPDRMFLAELLAGRTRLRYPERGQSSSDAGGAQEHEGATLLATPQMTRSIRRSPKLHGAPALRDQVGDPQSRKRGSRRRNATGAYRSRRRCGGTRPNASDHLVDLLWREQAVQVCGQHRRPPAPRQGVIDRLVVGQTQELFHRRRLGAVVSDEYGAPAARGQDRSVEEGWSAGEHGEGRAAGWGVVT